MARTLVEVFHNVPPGKRCSATIASARANAEGSDVELRVFPFPSEQATRRGVLSAPTLVVNGLPVAQGALTQEEVAASIKEGAGAALGVVLTKAPHGGPEAARALTLVRSALEDGARADLFLLSDGVLVAIKGLQGPLGEQLRAVIALGGQVYVSGPHVAAAGMGADRLVEGTHLEERPYDRLVGFIMEEHQYVLAL